MNEFASKAKCFLKLTLKIYVLCILLTHMDHAVMLSPFMNRDPLPQTAESLPGVEGICDSPSQKKALSYYDHHRRI